MKIFAPSAMLALAHCFDGLNAVHEHTAVNVELNLDEDTEILRSYAYDVRLTVPGIAVFLERTEKRGEHRIELINQGIPEHEAWILPTPDEFELALDRLSAHADFQLIEGQVHNYPHLRAIMFRHLPSGGVAQIVWRKDQIYQGLFS